MRLFLRENLSLVVFYFFQMILILLIVWLAGLKDLQLLFYILLISLLFFGGFLTYKYRTGQRMYRILSSRLLSIDESLRKLDHTPISTAVSNLLQSQYKIFQEQILQLEKKQEEHLIFIDRWVHQMKTPISILELIVKDLDEPESSNLREELDRLNEGLSTIMYMSKLRTIEEDFHIKQVSLTGLFDEIYQENKRLFIRSKVYPVIVKKEDLLVETDEKWLFFIINQLISNAVKYTDGRSDEIVFKIEKQDGRKLFQIKDYGVGIPKKDLKRIFNPFYTGENGRIFKESTGVGLYIVKEVLAYLGHDIRVQSEVGKGTSFTIIF